MRNQLKISKTTWILLGSGIFVVLMGLLGMTYRNQSEEQAGLNKQIAAVKQQIAKIPIDQLSEKDSQLKSQLAQTGARIAAVKASLIQTSTAANVVDTIYSLARTANLEIEDIKSAGISSQKIGKVLFSALPLTIKVKGAVSDIITFTRSISAKYSTSLVKPISVVVPDLEPVAPPPTPQQYTWAAEPGTLPKWATLDPHTGAIYGIPDTAETYTFTVTVTDKYGNTTSGPVTLKVGPPVLTIAGEMKDAGVTIPYNQSLKVTCDPMPATLPPPAPVLTPAADITLNILSYEGN